MHHAAIAIVRVLLLALGLVGGLGHAVLAAEDLRYDARIVGIDDETLLDALSAVSRTLSRQESPPPTQRVLDQRIAGDIARFAEVLRSEGYYQAKVEPQIGSGSPPIKIELKVDLGPPFLIGDVSIQIEPQPDDVTTPVSMEAETLGLKAGDRARAATIVEATERAIAILGTRSHPFAKLSERKVIVDYASQRVSVLLRLDPGPTTRFGAVEIEGLSGLDANYVRHRLGWSEGAPFDQSRLDEARRTLMRSGLFRSVKLSHAAVPDATGRLLITVTAIEGPARSIGGGASYSTDLGPGIRGLWEHRNLFGGAERFNVTGTLATTKQSLEGRFDKPDFPTASERLVVEGDLKSEEFDAFNTHTVRAGTRLEHDLAEHMTISGGLGLEQADIESQGSREQFSLVSTPLLFAFDTSDDLLEPTRGGRLELGVTPYLSAFGDNVRFTVAHLSDTLHWSPTGDGSIVLAGRAALGSLIGAETSDVPATKRLYSGGGGTVRGYAFQSVGPLDASHDPVGGRSLIEFSLEARFRIGESYGIVPFIDAGNVYDSEIPEFNGDLQWGGGLGLRYYTPIGPVRLDVAVPLNRRRGIDDAFQFYVSLGQAF